MSASENRRPAGASVPRGGGRRAAGGTAGEGRVKVGVIGLMPREAAEVTPATAARLRDLGFERRALDTGAAAGGGRGALRHVRDVLATGGVRVAQAVPRNQDLVCPDDARRRQGVTELQRACRAARLLEAATLYVRPGSLNPAGPWTPHQENTRLTTLERLVAGLREVARAAEDEGVTLALEGAAVSPLDTPERVRDVVEAVDSPALRFNADPVNFVRGLDDLYHTASLVHRLFDVCAGTSPRRTPKTSATRTPSPCACASAPSARACWTRRRSCAASGSVARTATCSSSTFRRIRCRPRSGRWTRPLPGPGSPGSPDRPDRPARTSQRSTGPP